MECHSKLVKEGEIGCNCVMKGEPLIVKLASSEEGIQACFLFLLLIM